MDPIHAALLQKMLGGGGPGGPPPGPGGPGGPPGPPGGPPGGGGPAPPNGHGIAPLDGVQSVIQDLHDLMRILPDPGAVSIAATCLKAMTGLQQQLMQPAGKGGGPGGPG